MESRSWWTRTARFGPRPSSESQRLAAGQDLVWLKRLLNSTFRRFHRLDDRVATQQDSADLGRGCHRTLVGKEVRVRADRATLKLFCDDDRVAHHEPTQSQRTPAAQAEGYAGIALMAYAPARDIRMVLTPAARISGTGGLGQ